MSLGNSKVDPWKHVSKVLTLAEPNERLRGRLRQRSRFEPDHVLIALGKLANAAKDTYDFLGSPEGELALAQLTVHLATAPKSNAVYRAYGAAMKAAKETGSLMPPKHILNAPTRLMKDLGYGKGYAYDHEAEESFSGQDYFPDEMDRQTFYDPKGLGAEKHIRERLDRWAEIRAKRGRT